MTTTTRAAEGGIKEKEGNRNSNAEDIPSRPPPPPVRPPAFRPPVDAHDVPANPIATNYPEPFASRMAGRVKRKLGDHFGLTNFGVNLTTLPPGGTSALKHHHTRQDEFVYVLSGRLGLLVTTTTTRTTRKAGDPTTTSTSTTEEVSYDLHPGQCVGFKANEGVPHQLVNRSHHEVATYLEIGDRSQGDQVTYPDDDLCAVSGPDGSSWVFTHKDGTPYPPK
jgi:uncharacterized cupin superfamily protein